jgi:cyclophilin family peptidyl-prolyl cis-trans isomerase
MDLRRRSIARLRPHGAAVAERLQDHAAAEPLEPRTLLANNGFPSLASMTDVNNSVVRLQVAWGSNRGNVDIELFDTQAPITTANFLGYVRRGDYDKTFFHRLVNGFVIQGGLARLNQPTNTGTFSSALDEIPTKAPILNEFSSSRSNVARTLSMAKIGPPQGQQPTPETINSATSQFFFNLANNSGNLDNQNGGFTVFARVVDEESWTVVQQFSGLSTSSLQTNSAYTQVPVSAPGVTGTNPAETEMVTILDAEIIKPKDVAAFYTYRYSYPEGFTGSNINEYLPMANNTNSTIHYQVVIRNEVRDPNPGNDRDYWYRDLVIDTNSITSFKRAGFQTSYAGQPARNLVPVAGKAYTYEIYSTGPLAVTLSHYDSGSSTIETFAGGVIPTAPATDPAGSARTWTFPDVRKGGSDANYLLWANLTAETANVSVTFYPDSGAAPITLNFPTQALRRGGLNINQLTQLPDGALSAQVVSDRPLIAALSQYNTSGAAPRGATGLGIPGEASRFGVLPYGTTNSTGTLTDQLSLLNTGSSAAIVELVFKFSDGTPDFPYTPFNNILGAGRRVTYDLGSLPELRGKSYSIRYTNNTSPIYASVLNAQFSDLAANPFAIAAATIHDFAEGFLDVNRNPSTLSERFAIYNPNELLIGGTALPANISFSLNYTDGSRITRSYAIPAGGRVEIDPVTFPEMIAKNQAGLFFFSVNVTSDVPVIAMGNHYDTQLGDSFLGTPRGTITRLDALNSFGG